MTTDLHHHFNQACPRYPVGRSALERSHGTKRETTGMKELVVRQQIPQSRAPTRLTGCIIPNTSEQNDAQNDPIHSLKRSSRSEVLLKKQ